MAAAVYNSYRCLCRMTCYVSLCDDDSQHWHQNQEHGLYLPFVNPDLEASLNGKDLMPFKSENRSR